MMCSSAQLSSTRIPILSGFATGNSATEAGSNLFARRFSGSRRRSVPGAGGWRFFFLDKLFTSHGPCLFFLPLSFPKSGGKMYDMRVYFRAAGERPVQPFMQWASPGAKLTKALLPMG